MISKMVFQEHVLKILDLRNGSGAPGRKIQILSAMIVGGDAPFSHLWPIMITSIQVAEETSGTLVVGCGSVRHQTVIYQYKKTEVEAPMWSGSTRRQSFLSRWKSLHSRCTKWNLGVCDASYLIDLSALLSFEPKVLLVDQPHQHHLGAS